MDQNALFAMVPIGRENAKTTVQIWDMADEFRIYSVRNWLIKLARQGAIKSEWAPNLNGHISLIFWKEPKS